MKYFIKTIVTGFFLLFTLSKTFAQPTFTLEDVTASTGSSFCMEITTTQLTNLFALDFSVNWDETLLEFTGAQNLNSSFAGANVNTISSASGFITFSFFGGPLTVPAGEVVFELCFDVIGTSGGSTDVDITGMPTNINVGALGGSFQTINVVGGTVSFPTPLIINMPDQIQSPGSSFCVPVSVENFTNLENIQNAILWDENVIQFDSLTAFNLSDLNLASFGFTLTADGFLSMSWNDDDNDPFNGVTLADGTVIFEICFTVVGSVNDMTTIVFSESLSPSTPLEVYEFGNSTNLGMEVNGGKINVQQIIFITNTTLTQPNCSNAFGGGINISVGGATGPYTYEWSNSSFDQDISGVGVGTYTVTISDSEIPANEFITSYNLNGDFNAPTADAGDFQMIDCTTTTTTLDGSASSAGADIIYAWTHGNGTATIIGDDTTMPTVNATGVYTLTVTDTLNGCSMTAQTVVDGTVVPPLVDAGELDSLTCDVTQIQLNGTVNPSGTYTYLWTETSGGNLVDGQNTLTPNIDEPGTYELLVTEDATGCSATDQVIITENIIAPIANAGTMMTLTCTETTVELDGTASSSGSNFSYQWTGLGNITDETTTTPTVDATGTYTLIVTNSANQCTATQTVMVDDNLTVPLAVVSDINDEITCTTNSVMLDGTGSSSGINFTYEWTSNPGNVAFDGTTLFPTVDEAGQYFLVVTDINNGCTAMDSTTITQDANIPEADAGPDRTLDCSTSSTVLDGSDSSLGSGFEYLWTPNPGNIVGDNTIINPTVNAGGIYTLQVTDIANNCTSISAVTVIVDTIPPVSNPDIPAMITCSQPQVELLGGSSSANSEIGFTWYSDGGSICNATALGDPIVCAPGTFCLVLTDLASTCKDTACVDVTQNITPPTANAGTDFALNCGQNSATLDGSGSSTGNDFIYNWVANSGNNPTNETSISPTVSSPGEYVIIVTDTINGCMEMDEVIVSEVDDYPIVEAGANGAITCLSPSVVLDASLVSSNGPGYDIVWTGSGVVMDGNENSLTPTVDQPGVYTLTITNLANNCSASDNLFVLSNTTTPVAVVVEDTVTIDCSQTTATLDGTGSTESGVAYLWKTLDGTIDDFGTTLMPVVSESGTYELIVFNLANGCSDTATVVVNSLGNEPLLDVQFPVNITCVSPEVTLDASGSVLMPNQTFEWVVSSQGNILSGAETLMPVVNQSGVYTFLVTDSVTTCTYGAAAFVFADTTNVVAMAMADAEIDCQNSLVNLEGSFTSSGPNIGTFWTTQDGNITTMDTTLLMVEANQVGLYQFIAVDTFNGCGDTIDVQIISNVDAPIADAGMDMELPCDVNSIFLDGSNSSMGVDFIYAWTTMNGSISDGADSPSPEISSIGTYILMVTDTTNGCSSMDTVEVINPLAVTATATTPVQLDCGVSSIFLDGTGSSTGGSITYLWTTSNGNIIGDNSILMPEVSAVGTYSLTVSDSQTGCSATTEVEVIFNNSFPNAMAGMDLTSCEETINLMAVLPPNTTGLWLSQGGAVPTDPASATTEVTNLQAGENIFIWTLSAIGCPEYSTDTMIVTLGNIPQAGDDSYTINEDQILNFDVSLNDNLPNGLFQALTGVANGMLVDNGSGSFTYTPNMGFVGIEEFDYELCSVLCPDDCDVAMVSIFVEEKEPLPLDSLLSQKTNTITPNGDGLNDNFVFDVLAQNFDDYPDNEFVVFNRWGDIVYEISPYNNDWGGTNQNGNPLPEGTYYYILRLDLSNGIIMKGDVTILR